jgi:hypothetical protein
MQKQSKGNFGDVVRALLIGGAIIWFIGICASSGAGSSTYTSRQVVATDRPAQVESSSVRSLPTPTKIPIRLRACVNDETIRIRKGPGTQYEMIGGLVSGSCMSVLGRNQDASWVYMAADGNRDGWVAAWFLSFDGNVYDVPVKEMLAVLPTYTAEVVMPKGNQSSGNVSSSDSGGNPARGSSSGGASSGGGVSVSGGSGATAICADGTQSFSAHRQGTCSHHGGVAQWLK